jgi:hypothetical protein
VDYYQDALTTPPSIGAYSGSSVGNTSTLVTFSELQVSEYRAIPSTYQAITGLTIAWNDLFRFGAYTWDGFQDHTQGGNASAPSIDIVTLTGGRGTSNTGSLSFSEPVAIPLIYVTNWDWWKQDVVLKGYTNINDTTPSITITVLYSNIPRHATGMTTGTWV